MSQYDRERDLYEAFRVSAETAVRELIRLEEIQVHSVSSRVKNRDSLSGKLGKVGKEEAYGCLGDITDIVGLRIITHIEDDVDQIGDLIRREFLIDAENSVDKRLVLDPDRFGYLSLHFVCQYNKERTAVAENKRFSGLKFEIQIRSILQHAWAEIEHDLGYKAGASVPAAIRRRFSRLAGLLEIADAEFCRLRNELAVYEKEVPEKIRLSPESVALDDVSLFSFIETNTYLRSIDERMASAAGAALEFDKWDGLASALKYVGISSINDLSAQLMMYEEVIFLQWKHWIDCDVATAKFYRHGIALHILWQILAVVNGGTDGLKKAFALIGHANLNGLDEHAELLAQKIEESGVLSARP